MSQSISRLRLGVLARAGIVCAACALATAATASGQDQGQDQGQGQGRLGTGSTAVTIPAPVGLVNDFAHVIPGNNAAHIERIASDVRTKSRGEMTVVTLPDIDSRDPADVALAIGRQWKVGKIGAPGDPTRNAGAVILLVPKETSSDGRGHCFIATGRGAEGFITDADAGDMCREATPFFRARDYGTGLELVTYRTAQRFADEFHFTLDSTLATTEEPLGQNYGDGAGGGGGGGGQHTRGMSPFALLFFLFVIFVLLSSLARRTGGPRGCLPIFLPFGGGWGGGGGGGGGWSGGGGGGISFGGGGGFSGGGGGSSW